MLQVHSNLSLIKDFIFSYLLIYPYLLIASSSVKEHQRNVEEVFERLKDYGPVINISKSLFGGEEISFT